MINQSAKSVTEIAFFTTFAPYPFSRRPLHPVLSYRYPFVTGLAPWQDSQAGLQPGTVNVEPLNPGLIKTPERNISVIIGTSFLYGCRFGSSIQDKRKELMIPSRATSRIPLVTRFSQSNCTASSGRVKSTNLF
ncbi:hypothetical protein ES703_109633 [subsurface metagenome]